MGGICSEKNFRSTVVSTPSGSAPEPDVHSSQGSDTEYQSCWWTSKTANNKDLTAQSTEDSMEEGQLQEPFSFLNMNINANNQSHGASVYDGIPRLTRVFPHNSRPTKFKPNATAKVSEVCTFLGRARTAGPVFQKKTAGLEKAVEVLYSLGSSMTNLNLSSGFSTGAITKGSKISILAFEVANTIVKGSNLMQSVSKENVKHLKEVVLPSEGVHNLVSKDMNELLRIAAADKREELKIFSGEVVCVGNRCTDPQWHNLDRYFGRLGSELTPQKQLKDEAETVMQQLMVSVQYTAELYHELLALDRFEQDYRRTMQEEDNSNRPQRGDNITISRLELKTQRKHVRRLKKTSLWCKFFEEVMDKLLDIVHYIHREINDAFGSAAADGQVKGSMSSNHRLGPAGLALHYANLITQIDTLVSCSSSVPPNTRDSLYQGLPRSIKSVLRTKLQSFQVKEQFTVPQIKAEMEKILQWLVPIATNTMKAHHVFGWACNGSEVKRMPIGETESIRIQTLYHADKEKTEAYILDLVVWLHHLICQSRFGMNVGFRSPIKSPIQFLTQMAILHPTSKVNSPSSILTDEDREMLQYVDKRKLTPGISRVMSLP